MMGKVAMLMEVVMAAQAVAAMRWPSTMVGLTRTMRGGKLARHGETGRLPPLPFSCLVRPKVGGCCLTETMDGSGQVGLSARPNTLSSAYG